jgi:beta-lactam-binding protein with PASTA domain
MCGMTSVVEARRPGRTLPAMLASAALVLSVAAFGIALTRHQHASCSASNPMQCPVTVPKFVGRPANDMRGDLRRNDLLQTVTFQRSVLEPKGVVLAQSPDPFAVVKRETTVVLVVSAGS